MITTEWTPKVTRKSKDVGDVKTRFNRSAGFRRTFEDMIQIRIKMELGIRD